MQEHLALPLISPAHRTDFKKDSPKQQQQQQKKKRQEKSTPPNLLTRRCQTASAVYINSTAPMQM